MTEQAEHPLFLGVDPGIKQHGLALLLSNSELLSTMWGGFQVLPGSQPHVGNFNLCAPQHIERLVVVIEFPEYQGKERAGWNYPATLKQATRLACLFSFCGMGRIYTPPARVILQSAGLPTNATDRQVSDYFRGRGIKIGRGTQLNSNHKRDALLAALWGKWLMNRPKTEHNNWIEPRT